MCQVSFILGKKNQTKTKENQTKQSKKNTPECSEIPLGLKEKHVSY